MAVSSSHDLRRQFPEGVFPANCPSRTVLEHVTSKWGALILLVLSEGQPVRWSELRRRAEGISEKMLAQTLRTLAEDGLVRREARPVVPPYVEYSLTDRGRELADRFVPVMSWIVDNAEAITRDRP
jgi:DNA-binding HxlR family transcriptional regulator